MGALSESKILKMSDHARQPQKLGTLHRKAGYFNDLWIQVAASFLRDDTRTAALCFRSEMVKHNGHSPAGTGTRARSGVAVM